jgi:hypothetical protein
VEHDLTSRDVELSRLVVAWRRGLHELRHGELERLGPSPLAGRAAEELFEQARELAEAKDELARALGAWLVLLDRERGAWPERVALARARRTPRPSAVLDAQLSLATLADQLLREPAAGRRERYARALPEIAAPAAELAVRLLLGRFEREGPGYLAVDGDETLAARLARALLDRSDDLAQGDRRPLAHALRAALATDAADGWPARLTARWVGGVFAGTQLGRGLDVRAPALPRPLGALSFARALGVFGALVQEATRPRTVPFCLHLPAKSSRRRRRFALFASIPAELSFLTATLGLGRDRAIAQRRAIARALLASLRIDAGRVLLAAGFLRGEAAGREAHLELGERIFSAPPPPETCAVLPELWPADAASLVGTLRAVGDRDDLVERYDEDWFRNPRAIESLRAADERVAPALDAEGLEGAVERLVSRLEDVIG